MPRPLPRALAAVLVLAGLTAWVASLDPPRATTPFSSVRAQEIGWNSIRFMDFQKQTELPADYDLSDTFVLPSTYEPWGLVINEVIRAGETGFLIQPGAVHMLAERRRVLCENPLARQRMGAAALRRTDEWDFESDFCGVKNALARVVAG